MFRDGDDPHDGSGTREVGVHRKKCPWSCDHAVVVSVRRDRRVSTVVLDDREVVVHAKRKVSPVSSDKRSNTTSAPSTSENDGVNPTGADEHLRRNGHRIDSRLTPPLYLNSGFQSSSALR